MYLREKDFLPQLAIWLTDLFTPGNLQRTAEILAAAGQVTPTTDDLAREDAQRRLADARARIRRCEDLLLTDSDPATVARWLNEAIAERGAAQVALSKAPKHETLAADDYIRMIEALPNPADAFAAGDPEDVQQLLAALGVVATYHPGERKLEVSVDLGWCAADRVGGARRTADTPLSMTVAL